MSDQAQLNIPAPQNRTPGVAAASVPFQRVKRRLVLGVLITPLLGVVLALGLWRKYPAGCQELGLLVGMYIATILGISVGFHRHLAHRSFQTTKTVRSLLTVLGSMAVQGPALTWAAIHRRHHRYSDGRGDPHSPWILPDGDEIAGGLWQGLWHSHVGWLFAAEITDWGHYVPDLLRDKNIFRLDRLYFLWVSLGLLLPAALGSLLTMTWIGALKGFLWGGLVRIFLVHHASWTIGSICHIYGSRPFEMKDESRNNAWLAILTVGDSWHNNHHAFPNSAMHGLRWSEIDLAGWVIRVLASIGLAWDVEIPKPGAIAAKQAQTQFPEAG